MVPADTRGDDRTKPVWGTPAATPAPGKDASKGPKAAAKAPGKGSGKAAPPRSKAEEARAAREQAKIARAEAKAARARAKQRGQAPAPARMAGRTAPAGRSAKAAAPASAKPAAARSTAKPATGRSRTAAPAGGARPAATAPAKRPAKRPAGRASSSRAVAFRKRYAVVHDVEGPRVRLGISWFGLALVGIVGGVLTTAVVYGGVAAVAAAQTARVWRKQKARPNEAMAAGAAGVVAAGACLGAGGAGLGLLGAVALAFVGAAGDVSSRNPRLADVGWTLQAALPPALVALSMVLLTRLDQGSAVSLLLLVSAFECGDFLIGSGSRNPYEGPAAGAAAIVVVTFIISTLPISALSFGEAWLLGGAVAVLAPAGQLLASALLPSATAPASALRRVDSLLIAAPLWAWAVGLFG